MGTEDNVKQSLRSSNKFRCDICGRKFSSETALASHQATVHSNALNRKRSNLKAALKPKKKKDKPKLFLKSKETIIPGESLPTDAIVKINEEAIKLSRDTVLAKTELIKEKSVSKKGRTLETSGKTTKFKCPHCTKVFNMLFPLKMHIGRDHGRKNGSTEKTEKTVLAKPNENTKKLVKLDKQSQSEYMCAGCKAKFPDLNWFHCHMEDVHSEGKETLYFPTISEFQTWREETQRKTRVKFGSEFKLDNANSMHICSKKVLTTLSIAKNSKLLCPSMILVQKTPQGFTVVFFKQHFGHESRKYILSDKFKKYSAITPIKIKRNSSKEPQKKLLYKKFKSIMHGIVKDAVKLSEVGLEIFIEKAHQMSSALSNYGDSAHREDRKLIDISMTPVKDVKSSDDDVKVTNKEESSLEVVEIKEEPSDLKSVETDDLNMEDSVAGPLVKKRPEMPKTYLKLNDKVLADETKNVLDSQTVLTDSSNEVTKAISPIFKSPSLKTNIIKMQAINKETNFNNSISSPKRKVIISDGSPVSNKITNKVAPMPNTSTINVGKISPAVLKKRKIVMKTKMGQFIPNSPKKSKPSIETNLKVPEQKTDKRDSVELKLNNINYKIIEQENDCNILVLKTNIFK